MSSIFPIAEATVPSLVASINKHVTNPIIIFLFALALVYFVYGLTKYLLAPSNEEVRKNSKQVMLWGVIGMFIMVSVFGIMNILLNTLNEKRIKINSGGQYQVDVGSLVK